MNDDNLRKGPWQGQQPPDIAEFLKKLREGLPGAGIIGGLILVAFIALTCCYSIQAGEVGSRAALREVRAPCNSGPEL